MLVTLNKYHKPGSILKEGGKQYEVISVRVNKAGYHHTIKKLALKNPAIKSATGWIKAKAIKIANGRIYIKK